MTALVEALAVEKRYRDRVVLRSITLSLAAGEVLGVAGPNGSGKSTLGRILLGFSCPSAGRVTIGGIEPSAFRETFGVGFVHEDGARGWERATLRDLLALRLSEPARYEDDEVCQVLRITALLDQPVASLSKGQWRICQTAYALVARPRFVLLDEPDAGLDPAAQERLRTAIAIVAAAGAGVIVFSHHLDELALGVQRLILLSRGMVQAEFDPRGLAAAALRRRYLAAAEGC